MMYAESERTSIMAILSLIFGVGGCCLGVTSIPAILLGILGLVGISRSKGRVGGTGFGIAGILVGLLSLALWGGFLFGGSYILKTTMNGFGKPSEQIFLDIQADNFDSARGLMLPPGSDVPDEELIAFREGYRSSLGKFVSMPDSMGDMMSGYIAVGPKIQAYSGHAGYVPMPMHFDSGWGLVFYVMDLKTKSNTIPKPVEFIVIDEQGKEYHLPMKSLPSSSTQMPESPTVPDPGGEPDEPTKVP